MDSKLNVYDILGSVIPGGVFLTGIGFLFQYRGIDIPDKVISGLTGTTVFLVVSYFLGQVIQGLGKLYESVWLVRRWGGMPSVRFLRPEDAHYSATMKELLWDAVRKDIGIELPREGQPSKETDRLRQEAFNLCYSRVIDRGVAKFAPTMNATYGLFRGLVVVSILCVLLFGLTAVLLAKEGGHSEVNLMTWLAVLFAFFTVIFSYRTRQRGEIFADNIFRSFLNLNRKT